MITYDKSVNNLSYTNKDFNAIYSELLDLADKISPKWKPSQSNESDPGVLLLKLDALIGDKANYNIDKNILELFPESVTQYPNAREIFEQCGYIMPYYRAAEVIANINIKNTDKLIGKVKEADTENSFGGTADLDTYKNLVYKLPKFTMISDTENTAVYTLIEDVDLPYSKEIVNVKALQGTVEDYRLNNNNLITYEQLDSNNRLYFSETNIAENGIFISNSVEKKPSDNFTAWTKVDNLTTQPLNTQCYKFGVSREGDRCYIEFPSDISSLIGEGLFIKYILTDGYAGNIGKRVLSKFYNDTKANINIYKSQSSKTIVVKDVEITTDEIYITNTLASEGGADPETLADARKNYERTKNTFDTLVSLRDYTNFVKNSDVCSNGFVCDRTNDIQHSYKVMTSDGEIDSLVTKVDRDAKTIITIINPEKEAGGDLSSTDYISETIYTDKLSAFDLTVYATKYVNPINTDTRFDLSFEPITSTQRLNLIEDMDDIKCIQHDIKALTTGESIAGIYLDYPIKAKIIPYTKLTTLQELEVLNNIVTSLYEHLNADQIEYGKEIDYDYVYDVISDSDSRIKSLILDEFDYTAYVLYFDNDNDNKPQLRPLDSTEELPTKFKNEIKAKAILAGVTPLLKRADNFSYAINQTGGDTSIKGVGKVTTNTELTIELTEGKGSIKLLDNESIYLTTNNYVTTNTYSTYTKYFYYLDSAIEPDGIHKLEKIDETSSEYIYFFYKTSSDKEAPYQYYRYKAGSIISPNFTIKAGTNIQTLPENATDVEKNYASRYIGDVLSKLDGDNGSVDDKKIGKLGKGSEQYYANEIIAACTQKCILDGTKQIAIKDTNDVILRAEKATDGSVEYPALPRAYWILNKTEKDSSSSTEKYVLMDEDENEYTLKTGEYLFYTDPTNTMFAMVGAGTRITRAGSTRELSVTAKSYKEVMIGVNNLLTEEGLWCKLLNDETLTLEEMQFHNIGAGAEFIIQGPKNYKSIKIDYEKIYYREDDENYQELLIDTETTGFDKDWKLSYKYDNIETSLPQVSAGWSGYSILNMNCGPDKVQELITEDNIREQSITVTHNYNAQNDEFTETASEELLGCSIETSYPVEVIGGENIDITYTDMLGKTNGIDFYKFTQVDYSGNENDNVDISDFNLKVEVKHNEISNLQTFTLPITTKASTNYYKYLLPVITQVDYKSLDIYNNYTTLNIATETVSGHIILFKPTYKTSEITIKATLYTINVSDTELIKDNDQYQIKLNTALELEGVDYQIDNIDIKISDDKKLISFKRTEANNDDIDSLLLDAGYHNITEEILLYSSVNNDTYAISTDESKLELINDSDLNKKGLHFLKLYDPSCIYTLVIDAKSDGTDTSPITFLSPIRFSEEDEALLYDGDDPTDLFTKLQALDYDNQFNYGYVVPDDKLIDNPLTAASFLDPNHPYNRATICRWNHKAEASSIKVTNKIK